LSPKTWQRPTGHQASGAGQEPYPGSQKTPFFAVASQVEISTT